jgi:hypothetical protein
MRRAAAAALTGLVVLACGDMAGPTTPTPVVSRYATSHFVIVDSAGASAGLIDTLKTALEDSYTKVGAFLPEFSPPPDAITMYIEPGDGLPGISASANAMAQFYNEGVLSLSYLPHQLTHLWTRYQRSGFVEEGLAVYVTTKLVPLDSHPDPYRTETPHEWTSLFSMKGSAIDLATAYVAQGFQFDLGGSSPDASAWQLFIEAGSFTQWVIENFGRAAWLRLYHADTFETGLGASAAQLQQQWFQSVQAAFPTPRACEDALAPLDTRETFWCRRANGQ